MRGSLQQWTSAACGLLVGIAAAGAVLKAVSPAAGGADRHSGGTTALRRALAKAVAAEDWELAAALKDAQAELLLREEELLQSITAGSLRPPTVRLPPSAAPPSAAAPQPPARPLPPPRSPHRPPLRPHRSAARRSEPKLPDPIPAASDAAPALRDREPEAYRGGDIEDDSVLLELAKARSYKGDIVFSIATKSAAHWVGNLFHQLSVHGVRHTVAITLTDDVCAALHAAGISCAYTTFGLHSMHPWAPASDPMGRGYRLERSKYRTLRRLAVLGLRPLFIDADITVRANPYIALDKMSRFALVTASGGGSTCLGPLACMLYCRRCERGGAAHRLLQEMELRWRRYRNATYWGHVFWRRLDELNATEGPYKEDPFHRANNMLADITMSSCCGKHLYLKVKPSKPRVIRSQQLIDNMIGPAAGSVCGAMHKDPETGARWHPLKYVPDAGGGTPESESDAAPRDDAIAYAPHWLLANWNGWGAPAPGERGLFSSGAADQAPLWHYLGAPGGAKTQLMRVLGQWSDEADRTAQAAGALTSGGGSESFNAHRDSYLASLPRVEEAAERWLWVTGLDEALRVESVRQFAERYAVLRYLLSECASRLGRRWAEVEVPLDAPFLPKADDFSEADCGPRRMLCEAHLNLLQNFAGDGRVAKPPPAQRPALLPAVIVTKCAAPPPQPPRTCGSAVWRYNGTTIQALSMPDCGARTVRTQHTIAHFCTQPAVAAAKFASVLSAMGRDDPSNSFLTTVPLRDSGLDAGSALLGASSAVVHLQLNLRAVRGESVWEKVKRLLLATVAVLPPSKQRLSGPCVGLCSGWDAANMTASTD
eukprot:TRINITY_DN7660_c2_g1_i1.p1 TRINITY_DN7660_c2_g1~~TRINITY_DN7660_c2_g1_i1.p1  ORF type:complete len:851 (+),score=169.74 TRINITY_DN7660_c2_g1_i1:80-2554(+)